MSSEDNITINLVSPTTEMSDYKYTSYSGIPFWVKDDPLNISGIIAEELYRYKSGKRVGNVINSGIFRIESSKISFGTIDKLPKHLQPSYDFLMFREKLISALDFIYRAAKETIRQSVDTNENFESDRELQEHLENMAMASRKVAMEAASKRYPLQDTWTPYSLSYDDAFQVCQDMTNCSIQTLQYASRRFSMSVSLTETRKGLRIRFSEQTDDTDDTHAACLTELWIAKLMGEVPLGSFVGDFEVNDNGTVHNMSLTVPCTAVLCKEWKSKNSAGILSDGDGYVVKTSKAVPPGFNVKDRYLLKKELGGVS